MYWYADPGFLRRNSLTCVNGAREVGPGLLDGPLLLKDSGYQRGVTFDGSRLILLSLLLLAGRMQSGKIDFLAFLRVSNHSSAYPVAHNLGYCMLVMSVLYHCHWVSFCQASSTRSHQHAETYQLLLSGMKVLVLEWCAEKMCLRHVLRHSKINNMNRTDASLIVYLYAYVL